MRYPDPALSEEAQARDLLEQLQAMEFGSAGRLQAFQAAQLQLLLEHHARHTPWFARRLATQDLTPQDLLIGSLAWQRLAPLRRAEVQAAGRQLFSHLVPALHLPVAYGESSGSTGEPVTVRRTRINQLLLLANSARDHRWHGRPADGGRMAVIRSRFGRVEEDGRGMGIPVTTSLAEQARLIARFQPDTLMLYPGNLQALLDEWRDGPTRPPASLRHLRTMGETVHERLRERARREQGLPVEDGYSSEELGALAAQCPHSGLYHSMDESVLLEVVREADGSPCAPGEIGQVLVTDLHNLATPLIRYAIADLAEPGPACSCGRALGTLRRIVGRERNLLRLPDGTRRWTRLYDQDYASVAPVRQYQVLQHSLRDVELRVVLEGGGLSAAQAEGLAQIVRKALDAPFEIRVQEFQGRLPLGANGKFEDFVCLIKD